MRLGIRGFAVSIAFATSFLGSGANAALIFVSTANSQLQTIDIASHATTLIGNAGAVLFDITFSPSGALFRTDSDNSYAVDCATAPATLIGSLGIPFVNALGFDSAGVLYGAGEDSLFTINTSMGAATLVGTGSFLSAGDLDYVGNTLFISSGGPFSPSPSFLVSLNPVSASATPVGPLLFSDVFGLANDAASSTLFGLTLTGQVLSVNTTTGAASELFDTEINNVFGAAVNPVPGPLPVLGAGMAIGWSRRLRQRIRRSRHGVIPTTKV